jgi:hypothetical protein
VVYGRVLGSWFSQLAKRAVRPTMTFFSIATISMAWSGRIVKRMIQTRRIHRNLVVVDPFEDEGDLLGGRMDEV